MGYDQIPATLPVAPPGRGLTRVQQQRRRLIQALADAGLTEVLAYPFVSKAANDTFGVAEAGCLPDGASSWPTRSARSTATCGRPSCRA